MCWTIYSITFCASPADRELQTSVGRCILTFEPLSPINITAANVWCYHLWVKEVLSLQQWEYSILNMNIQFQWIFSLDKNINKSYLGYQKSLHMIYSFHMTLNKYTPNKKSSWVCTFTVLTGYPVQHLH